MVLLPFILESSSPMPGEKKKKTNHGSNGEASTTNGGGAEQEWYEMNGIRDKESGRKNKGKVFKLFVGAFFSSLFCRTKRGKKYETFVTSFS